MPGGRWMVFRTLLDFVGFDTRRIFFSWVSAAEGAKWAHLVNEMAELKSGTRGLSKISAMANADSLYHGEQVCLNCTILHAGYWKLKR